MSGGDNSFACSICGAQHSGLPIDQGYTLPDIVWSLPEPVRSEQAKWSSDLCQMGELYYIRCLLPVPFVDRKGYFGWGVWVQVEWPIFERYLEVFESDATSEPVVKGILANQLPDYASHIGAEVVVQFGISSQRPTLHFPFGAGHQLAIEQLHGIGNERYHAIMVSVGAISP